MSFLANMDKDLESEEIEFVNFPDTNLDAFASRALAVDSAIIFEPFAHSQEPSPYNSVSYGEKITVVSMDKRQVSATKSITSPCPSKPLRLPPQCHAYCQQQQYDILCGAINASLENMMEFDFSYDPASLLWRGKSISGARFLEIVVRCYWDKCRKDHILSVNKVAGDLLNLSANHVFQRLRMSLQLSTAADCSSTQNRTSPAHYNTTGSQGCCRMPPSLPLLRRCNDVKTAALEHIFAMLESPVVDMYCEAARMFNECVACASTDFAGSDMYLLQDIATRLFHIAANDAVDKDVRMVAQQCAVSSLLELSKIAVFAPLFQTPFLLSTLMELAMKDGADASQDFVNIAVRRMAAEVLVEAYSRYSQPRTVFASLLESIFITIRDGKLRSLCSSQLLPLLV